MSDLMAVERPAAWWLNPEGAPGPLLRACLTAAVAAPSVHNTQPWLFQPHRGGVDVYPDWDRQVPVVDPGGRELLMSLGAAVFNLRVAIRANGRIPVQVMPSRRDPAVRVSPGAAAAVPYTARALAWAIPRRRSNRWPFANTELPHTVQVRLAAAATTEGATLRMQAPDARHRVLDLVRTAEHHWREDPAYLAELARWTGDPPDRRDGVPPPAFGPRSAAEHVPVRDFGLAQPSLPRREVRFEQSPTIAVLYAHDTPLDWVRVGQALQRTLLTATVHGVTTSLLTQPLGIPRLRELMRDPITGQPAQAIVRLGYSRRNGAASRRRPLAAFLP